MEGSPSNLIPRLEGQYIDEGRFLLKKVIGRGGWGVVYLASELESQECYAVKCVRNTNSLDDDLPLPNEITLHHACAQATDGVLKIHQVTIDEDQGLLFIVTDYCEDSDLLEFIMRDKFIGKDDYIRNIFLQVLDAVEACHNIRVYHRDLKPENILVKENGKKIALADFGFATTEKRSIDFRLGSDPFMAPGMYFIMVKFCTDYALRGSRWLSLLRSLVFSSSSGHMGPRNRSYESRLQLFTMGQGLCKRPWICLLCNSRSRLPPSLFPNLYRIE